MSAVQLLMWGWVLHLLADIFLQNAWMSEHKKDLNHLAAWVHGAIHLAALLVVFPPVAAVLLALSHVLIDTRRPLVVWRRLYRQSTVVADSHPALHAFAFWQDQSAHILALAIAAVCIDHAWVAHLWWWQP